MNIQDLIVALEHAREQLFQAEKQLDATTEPELIDAAIFEQKAWEERCKFYNRKLKEAVAGGQAIPRQRLIHSRGRG
jgi:hypothetical protein